MQNLILLMVFSMLFFSCKEETKASVSDLEKDVLEVVEEKTDSIIEVVEVEIQKSTKQLKQELTAEGFKIFDYVDEKTQDTILMQQYFMAFFKNRANTWAK